MSIAEKLSRSLGLESEAATVEINVDVDEAGAPLDDVDMNGDPTPEADEAELLEAAQEIDETNDEIDELEEAQATLESIYSAMYQDYQDGGMTPEAVKFAAIAVESVGVKYGITGDDVGISLESFQSDRLTASTISMEGVRDFIDGVVDAIVKKLKELMQKLREFYQKNIAAAARLKRRAESIKKKARAKSSYSADEKEIGDELFSRLNVRGKVPTVDQIKTGLKATELTGKPENRMTESDLEKQLSEVLKKDTLTDEGSFKTAVVGQVNNEFKGTSSVSSNFEVGGTKVSSNNFTGVTELPGNVAIGLVIPSETVDRGVDDVSKLRGGKFKDDSTVKETDKKKLSTLTISEIETVCDSVIEVMGSMIRNKAAKPDEGKRVTKIIEKQGKKVIDDLEIEDNAAQSNASKALRIITNKYRATENVAAAKMNYNVSLAKSALAYCSRSLSKYKKD